MEQDLHRHVLLQQIPAVAQLLSVEDELLIVAGVHEGILLVGSIQEFHFQLVQIRCLQLLT